MRHLVKGKKLGRTKNKRTALERQLLISLFTKKRITTTLQKAKYLKPKAERAITKAKQDNKLVAKRAIHSMLMHKEAEKLLLTKIAKKYKDRMGGYTRIVKLGTKKDGDNSPKAIIELV